MPSNKRPRSYQLICSSLALCGALLLAACQPKQAPPSNGDSSPELITGQQGQQSQAKKLVEPETLIALGGLELNASLSSSKQLVLAVQQLLEEPSADKLSEVAQLWQQTNGHYQRFSVFTKLANRQQPELNTLSALNYQVAAWPIQPGYLDAYGPHTYSGLVFDIGIELNEESLRNQHGMMDEEGVTLGLYPLEFLLFGEQDQRSFLALKAILALSEADKERGFQQVDELPRNRRRKLILLQSRLLVEDLSLMQTFWASTSASSPSPSLLYLNALPADALHKLIKNAALSLVTQQLLEVSEQAKPSDQSTELRRWRDLQLIQRIGGQTQGLKDFVDLSSPLFSKQCLEDIAKLEQALQDASAQPPVNAAGIATTIDWQSIHQSLNALVQSLSY